jgi:hypothetical protein
MDEIVGARVLPISLAWIISLDHEQLTPARNASTAEPLVSHTLIPDLWLGRFRLSVL